ncbi:unnamed protein product, partial [Iphiclides podalirius]
MACDLDELEKNIENLRAIVRQSFARIYASLKARELKTLRQLDAIRKQCQDDKDLKRNCVQSIEISYENEPVILENISKFGAIDFEKLNFDSKTFTLEDYVSPDDDHMYLYKTIEDVTKKEDINDLEAIEEAALKEVTSTENCIASDKIIESNVNDDNECPVVLEDEISECSDSEMKKINPTDDWLNSIKNQTETEPTQVTDVMEHSTITCS